MHRVAAIVVLYQPDVSTLQHLLKILTAQVAHTFLIDNSAADAALAVQADDAVTYLPMAHNAGVASALNRGVEAARATDASHVLLLDQDSMPGEGMVETLLSELKRTPGAVVGPTYKCENTLRWCSALQRTRLGWRRVVQNKPGEAADTEMLITSGSLMAMDTLSAVGPFDDALFIDYVDTDWCLRARQAGVTLKVVSRAVMQHRLGSGRLRVWWGGWRFLPTHSPERVFYMIRNSLWLHRRPHAYAAFVFFDLRRLPVVLMINVLANEHPSAVFRMAWRGLRAGLRRTPQQQVTLS